jgi:hypothetical protein
MVEILKTTKQGRGFIDKTYTKQENRITILYNTVLLRGLKILFYRNDMEMFLSLFISLSVNIN